ncbi:helix-turn-helix transcriptional regulator [Terrabacter sp. C0L_2]|uniref:helix-turn-helix transcriptional regulator n=1 Tax=Terrabacter sp. C0L_2 TaxID=3108389 RepID=UPI002ED0F047|nr:LuxR C-terminal-related transcriptional regulator [Terrabacter sp. C0L_2]
MTDSCVHEDDVIRLLEILDHAHVWDPDDIFYTSVLAELAELMPADEVAFQVTAWLRLSGVVLQVAGGRRTVMVLTGADPDDLVLCRACAGLSEQFGSHGVTAHTEVSGGRRTSGVLGFLAPVGELDRRVLLHRHGGPAFSTREVDLLRLARPHLAELHLRRRAELHGLSSLTPRQWEILHLVAMGATNLQIAHRLLISEGTVRKHLEHAYARLGVVSRTEAVATLLGQL